MSDERVTIEDKKDDEFNQGCFGSVLGVISTIVIIVTLPLSIWFCIKIIQEYERAAIFRLGRLKSSKAVGPGLFWINMFTDSFIKVDLRTVSFDIPSQEILTKDSVTIRVDAVCYYRKVDATKSVCEVEDADSSTRLLAQTTLRNTLGTKTLTEVLSQREQISATMQSVLDGATDPWGISVERVEVKDVVLPSQLQRVMAAEAEATREAKAKIIQAEGEMNAAKSLLEAAKTIAECPQAIQLRYLQTLTTISAEKNSTIIFPLPIEMMSNFGPKPALQ